MDARSQAEYFEMLLASLSFIGDELKRICDLLEKASVPVIINHGSDDNKHFGSAAMMRDFEAARNGKGGK